MSFVFVLHSNNYKILSKYWYIYTGCSDWMSTFVYMVVIPNLNYFDAYGCCCCCFLTLLDKHIQIDSYRNISSEYVNWWYFMFALSLFLLFTFQTDHFIRKIKYFLVPGTDWQWVRNERKQNMFRKHNWSKYNWAWISNNFDFSRNEASTKFTENTFLLWNKM